jgi:hypothetical protein
MPRIPSGQRIRVPSVNPELVEAIEGLRRELATPEYPNQVEGTWSSTTTITNAVPQDILVSEPIAVADENWLRATIPVDPVPVPEPEPESRVVWKFPLEIKPFQKVKIPSYREHNREVLDIGIQDGTPVLWVLFNNPDNRPVVYDDIRVRCLATGQHFAGYPGDHLGTVQNNGMVFHFFETPEDE